MAGEKIGKTYEALLKVALDALRHRKAFSGKIFWNEKPTGISVEPDFLLGTTPVNPAVVILVTHSGSSGSSHKKAWRNIGELCEVKTSFPSPPSAINIVFNASMKEGIKRMEAACFDHMLVVEDRPYGKILLDWVKNHYECLPVDQEEKAQAIARSIRKYPLFGRAMKRLEKDIQSMFHSSRENLQKLWEQERSRSRGTAPNSRSTFLRRGLGKLLVFDDLDLAFKLFNGARVSSRDVPKFLFQCGLVKKGVGGVKLEDADIQYALNLLPKELVQKCYASAQPVPGLQLLVEQARNPENLTFMGQYIITHFSSLSKSDTLLELVRALHDDPMAISGDGCPESCWPPKEVWILTFLIELFKATSGKANGDGISQIAEEVVNAGYGRRDDVKDAGQFGGGQGFSGWLKRKADSPFRDDLLQGVCYVLSEKLSALGVEKTKILINSGRVSELYLHNLLTNKISTHKQFEPLLVLLLESIKDAKKRSIRSCFAENAGVKYTTGCTTIVQSNGHIVHWKSAYDGHPADKTKELCGRAVGIRYTWEPSSGSFIPRSGVNKLILLLDGTWTQKHLDSLVRAGWDEIYYPDEIEKLKTSILGPPKKAEKK